MRKKTLLILTAVITLSLSMLAGCGNQQEVNNNITEQPTTTEAPTSTPTEAPTPTPTEPPTPTPTPTETPTPTPTETPTPTPTETPHEHAYTESTNKEATCTEAGEKTFTCDCGDTYTEQIEATGHNFAEYVYNNDATYTADGTETATCVCGLNDTRTASGTKLELPAEPNLYGMEFKESIPQIPQYCMEDTDVYFEPSFQSPVIGHLSVNDEVKRNGWANNYEANGNENYPPFDKTEAPTDIYWYRIDYNGQTGYIPSSYVWKVKRDTSITLNPLYANYPTIGGGGSGLFYPYEKEWRYVYGCNSRKTIYLHPQLSSVDIYDGIGLNVIATITDSSIKFEPTGNAYATYRDDVGSYYIYEIYYNGGIAYMDSLKAMRE